MDDVIETSRTGGKTPQARAAEKTRTVRADARRPEKIEAASEIKEIIAEPEIGSLPTSRKRKAASEERQDFLHRVAEDASGKVARAVQKMREGANLTTVQLAARMEMSSVGYLRAIERQTKRKTPTGEMKYVKVSLETLCEIAAETGHVLTLKIEKR